MLWSREHVRELDNAPLAHRSQPLTSLSLRVCRESDLQGQCVREPLLVMISLSRVRR